MQTKSHSFDIETATKYGVEKAILLQNFRFWLDKEHANIRENSNKVQEHNGILYVWTYNSAAAFANLFPYFTKRSISRWLKELEEEDVLISGIFNEKNYDKTKWYTMPEYSLSQNGVTVSQNGPSIGQNGQPIPDINTNIKHISSAKKKKAREKNELLDTFLAEMHPGQEKYTGSQYSLAQKALNDIKQAEPKLTVERLTSEIRAILAKYPDSMEMAIPKFWGKYAKTKQKPKEDPLEIRYKALFSALITFKQASGEGLTVRQKEICAKITDHCTKQDLQLDKIMVDKKQLLGIYNEIVS